MRVWVLGVLLLVPTVGALPHAGPATASPEHALESQVAAAPVPTETAPSGRVGNPDLQLTRADPAPASPGGAAYAGRGVTVAVVDSGIDTTHPDLAGRVKANVKLVNGQFVATPGDSNGHGTHVAGIVAADGSSSSGRYRGVAPEADLVGIDISDKFTTASAILAYDWLYVHRQEYGIRVVVNAWGRVGETSPFSPDDAEIRAIDRLVDAGVVVVFSASNHGPAFSTLSTEASDPRVVSVGAVDAAAQLASYSSRGPVVAEGGKVDWVKPDLVAPGDVVIGLRSLQSPPSPEADVDAFHRAYSGTSQAAPHVAGIVALMLEANSSLTPTAVQNALHESAIDLGAPGPDVSTGFGLVDAVDAVHRARGESVDRGNVLAAGGTDTFEDHADVGAPSAARSGLLGFVSTPTSQWVTTFPVKAGAAGLRFELSWSSSVAPVTVTLVHDGQSAGTWSESSVEEGRAVVRGRLDAPQTGVWTLRAEGGAPVTVDVASRVDVDLRANATRALELDQRYRLPDTPGSVFGRAAGGDVSALYLQARLFVTAHPGVPPSLVAGFLFAFVLLGRVTGRAARRRRVRVVVERVPGTDND